jgi:hypothetical protein
MTVARELPSLRFSLVTLSLYALVLGGGWVAVKRQPAQAGLIPHGRWLSSTTQGDTVTTRLLEFPWGPQGIWTMHRSVGTQVLRGDYRMFTLQPTGPRQYCLRVASESEGCLSLFWGTDSVIVTQPRDSIKWTFHALPP